MKYEITEAEHKLFEKLKTIMIHAKADKYQDVYFICGEAGDKDQMGLPQMILVCPAHGLDGFAVYSKEKDYSPPSWY